MPSAPWFNLKTGRNTLQPLSISRHLKHAAQTLHPQGSPSSYATCIDFKQTSTKMTHTILIDGDKQASVQPLPSWQRTKFSICVNDIGHITEGATGA
eukprot:259348-Pelagomonas_calceolata.AAC.1